MEAGESVLDSEVFLGEITEREKNHPAFNSRRRTTVYFPGVSRPDSSFSIHKEFTDDGTLIFSCEETEEPGLECSAVNKPGNTSESSGLQSSIVTLSKRGEKSLNSESLIDNLSEESDMDSGFSSVSSVTAVSPFPSLTLSEAETKNFMLTPKTKLKGRGVLTLSEDGKRKRGQLSPAVETVQLQSPCLSVSPLTKAADLSPDTTSVKRHIECKESFATAAITSPSLLVNKTTSAFSKLKLESPKCDLSSNPAIIKDFPKCFTTDSSCISLTPSNYQGTLPLKRKIAQRSPSVELKTDIQNTIHIKAESRTKERNNSVTLSAKTTVEDAGSDCDHVSCSCLFVVTSSDRKQQKLDMDCDDQVPESGKKTKFMSLLSAGGDAHMRQIRSDIPHVLVPDTPNIKTLSFASSERDLTSSRFLVQSQSEDDDPDIVPSSQRTETDASPVVNKLSATTSNTKQMDSSSSIVSLHTALVSVNRHALQTNLSVPLSPDFLSSQATPLSANRHAMHTNLSTQLSPVLFSSPCLDKSPGSVLPSTPTASKESVHSPVPGPTECFIAKGKPSPQSLQPMQIEQRKAKYGRLILRKPMATVRRRGGKENRLKLFSDSVSSSSSFVQFHEADPPSTALNNPEATLSRPRRKYKCATFAARNENIASDKELSFEQPAPPRIEHQGSPASVAEHRHRTFSEELLEADSKAAVTCINTMINGETRHFLLDPQSSPALLTDFPPPKEATRVRWSDQLAEEPSAGLKPVQTPVTPRSILQQRSADHKFPFSRDPPSPIVLTRRRLPKFANIFTFDN